MEKGREGPRWLNGLKCLLTLWLSPSRFESNSCSGGKVAQYVWQRLVVFSKYSGYFTRFKNPLPGYKWKKVVTMVVSMCLPITVPLTTKVWILLRKLPGVKKICQLPCQGLWFSPGMHYRVFYHPWSDCLDINKEILTGCKTLHYTPFHSWNFNRINTHHILRWFQLRNSFAYFP